MMVNVSKIQKELLLVAAQRKDRCIATSRSLASTGVSAAISDLIARGLIIEAVAKNDALVWRRDDNEGAAYGLRLTAAGRKLAAELAIPPDVAEGSEQADAARNFKAVGRILKARTRKAAASQGTADQSEAGVLGTRNSEHAISCHVHSAGDMPAPRKNTKASTLIELLSHGSGKSVQELAAAMNWLPHTTRAALTGLRKRGVPLLRERTEGAAVSVYRIEGARPGGSPATSDGARLRA
jgi:DNA-binding MarR family transcriptional regulator